MRLGSEHDASRFLHKYMVQTSDQRVSWVINIFQNTTKVLVEIKPWREGYVTYYDEYAKSNHLVENKIDKLTTNGFPPSVPLGESHIHIDVNAELVHFMLVAVGSEGW